MKNVPIQYANPADAGQVMLIC